MIRVIHFVPSLNCTSGIANFLMNYYRKLNTSNIQFDFIYFGNDQSNNYKNEVNKLGGHFYKICSPVKYSKFKKELSSVLSAYSDKKNTIFHNHQIAFTVFLKKIVSSIGINHFIVHNHMTKFSDKIFSSIRNYILCIPIKYMKNIYYFACSDEAGKIVFGRNKFVIMENGIDCSKFVFNEEKRKKFRKEYNISDNTVLLGNIGRFERVKNHKKILDIFIEYKRKNQKSKLLLVGTGSLKNEIIKYINMKKIAEDVIILENRLDIPNILFAMDFFVFPSKFEGLGIAAVEAQAAGVPVFMSNVIPKGVDIINTKRINLSLPASKWCDSICMLPSFSERINSNYYVKQSKYNINNNVKFIEQIYCKIVDKGEEE